MSEPDAELSDVDKAFEIRKSYFKVLSFYEEQHTISKTF